MGGGIDGAVVWSDQVTCADDEAKPLRDIEDDDRIWDVVWYGLEDEDANEVVELSRISRVTEVDGESHVGAWPIGSTPPHDRRPQQHRRTETSGA